MNSIQQPDQFWRFPLNAAFLINTHTSGLLFNTGSQMIGCNFDVNSEIPKCSSVWLRAMMNSCFELA